MSTVSNRFYVEAIDDGSTLHGQLLSTKALTQAWNGSASIPDWTQAANQPIVFVDLLSGTQKVSPDAGGTWYYNNQEIIWADSTATAVSTDGRFQKVNNYPTSGSPTAAIKIIANLASGSNINTDSISYSGQYTISGSPIEFNLSTLVRITSVSSSSVFGFIEFVGSNIITEDHPTVTMYGRLFSANGDEIVETSASGIKFTTAWKMNNASIGAGRDITVDGVKYYNAIQVSEADITDNSVVECEFSYVVSVDGTPTTLKYKTFENVDDQSDLEQMYIQYNGGNDTSAVLKKNGSITWNIWMGKQDDPTVDATWVDFYVKLLDADGNVVTGNISGIPNTITTSGDAHEGWRKLPWDGTKASITITYDIVHDSATFKKYLTGIVLAEKS